MKSHDDITFYHSVGVAYTHEQYAGASVFHYKCRYVPTDKVIDRKIYGVTPENGRKLVEYWNGQNPLVWEYWEDLSSNALKPHDNPR